MAESTDEMMRQIVRYGMEEMRNRGLEDAAAVVRRQYRHAYGRARYDGEEIAQSILAMKRNASGHLTDWWAPRPTFQVLDMAPLGA